MKSRVPGPLRGSSLVITFLIVALVVSLAGGALILSLQQSRQTDRLRDRVRAHAVARRGLEEVILQMRRETANNIPLTLSGIIPVSEGPHGSNPIPVTYDVTPRNLNLPGALGRLVGVRDQFEVRAMTTFHREDPAVPDRRSGRESIARVTRIVDLYRFPLFQFLAFYETDLECMNGPSARYNGRMHTNGNLYVRTLEGATFDTDWLQAHGELFRRRRDGGPLLAERGRVDVRSATGAWADWPESLESRTGGVPNPTFEAEALSRWGGVVRHHADRIQVPEVQSFAEGGFYHERARMAGQNNLLIAGREAFLNGQPVDSTPWLTRKVVYDHREGVPVSVTEIDMTALRAADHFPSGGLIFAHRDGADPGGIRLVRGAELTRDLTVVTPDPLYVQGDYNTATPKSAALMADAINLLSGAWDDSKTATGPLPAAGETSFNAAMMTGNVPSIEGGSYSGGLENLPRFHEDWSGVTCHIRGAFAVLFESRGARGRWAIGGHYYLPPVRDWGFETLFNVRIPPYTPQGVLARTILHFEGRTSWRENRPDEELREGP